MENDNDLMLAFKNGDEDAFNILFNKHLHNVLNISYKIIRNIEIAEDIAQEVFLRIYRFKDRYEPTAKFSTYLYRITTNLTLNYIRDNQKKKMHSFSELTTDNASKELEHLIENPNSEQPSENLEKSEFQKIIDDAVAQLPENQRIALYLSKYLNLSYTEISEIMNHSIPSIKSLISRARDTLRNILSNVLDK